MSINQTYAVFGLGRYGTSVAKELVKNGAEVLAIDIDETIVNSAIADIPFCKCADVTNIEVIRQLGVASIDTVIIAMAGSLEASVMAVMLCKDVGVKTVIAKCADEVQGKILAKVGADKVVFPEVESGVRLAKNLVSAGFVDMVELSKNVSLVDLDVKSEWVGKNLVELQLRKRYSVNVIAIRRGDDIDIDIDPTMKLDATMKLILIADVAKLAKLNA